MTAAQSFAYRFRRWILVIGILFTIAAIVWAVLPFFNKMFNDSNFCGLLATPLAPPQFAGQDEWHYCVNLVFVLGLILLAQWAFLRPGKNWKVRMLTEGRPLKTSIFAAALMAALLTTGGIALLLELPNWWESILGEQENALRPLLILGVMVLIWAAWACIFWVYWKQGDRYTQLGKMIRGLIAGSILEIMVAVPVHIWAVRQRECYCCRGTYTTLAVLGGTILIWAFGPGIILLYWREKYRREKLIQQNPPDEDESLITN